VATSDELYVRAVRLVNFDRAKENLVAISASSPADPIQKTGEKGISVSSIGSAMPYQGDRARLSARQTASGVVGVIVQAPSRLEDSLARLNADVGIRHRIQYERNCRTRDPRFFRDLALSYVRVGEHWLPASVPGANARYQYNPRRALCQGVSENEDDFPTGWVGA
jgi:hypothetical protein